MVVPITDEEKKILMTLVAYASFNGVSRIREPEDRKKNCVQDQWVGLASEYAFQKLMTGKPIMEEFIGKRLEHNCDVHKGDGGSDLPLANVDVKGSQIPIGREQKQSLLDHHLLVRPRERHLNCTYVRAFIREEDQQSVVFVGCLEENELPDEVSTRPGIEGAFAVLVRDLHRLPHLHRDWDAMHAKYLPLRSQRLWKYINEVCGGEWKTGEISFERFVWQGGRSLLVPKLMGEISGPACCETSAQA